MSVLERGTRLFLWRNGVTCWFSLLLMACTQTNPARVTDISDSAVVAKNRSHVNQNQPAWQPIEPPTTDTVIVERPIVIKKAVNKRQPVAAVEPLRQTAPTTSASPIRYSRNYRALPKGSYQKDTYRVKHGDTLFYIAWITGTDYHQLAMRNNIKEPYRLSVDQLLTIRPTAIVVSRQANAQTVAKVAGQTAVVPRSTGSVIQWYWPAKGKVIESFSMKNKGIDIGGKPGEKVVAAARGQVVYTGNALPGYGNLIIIKHNDDYLTAYAHNNTILIKEQQQVQAGDLIATMGNTGASSTRLHFEIRYKAQSVDPMKYLPKGKS